MLLGVHASEYACEVEVRGLQTEAAHAARGSWHRRCPTAPHSGLLPGCEHAVAHPWSIGEQLPSRDPISRITLEQSIEQRDRLLGQEPRRVTQVDGHHLLPDLIG